jgi:hypothetical protein
MRFWLWMDRDDIRYDGWLRAQVDDDWFESIQTDVAYIVVGQ